ncbi:protein YLS3-like [Pyrus ussuriensis x Pyrus communis]|uniref:Protein YLS3-like n=1 Tax=Pyrus ussuriensis x Pyrus communis TaxID=2448454 RepID=A0A5N5G1H7_9ROSA|nr:non-specific lipid transfer protein GPI-anchored 6 isoform X1 [Pyrus x bretschneideri]XP_018504630.1 non-specific lipid transfer protein GPI-anchored 6 isoform X1 [Pyrus x bretschneideri]KAB2607510.1 protein YLS3-like [Pyrus ussuriensis x Pyrus communis]
MSNSKDVSVQALTCALVLIFLVGFGSCNIDQDRAECTDQLVGLAPCIPYVGGDAKTPTLDCCSGIKEVVQKSKKCLCILIKDRDDPKLGLKINSTLALNLPSSCHVPVNISTCIDLLNLPSNSPDAKMFRDFENQTEARSNSTAPLSSVNSTSSGTVAQAKSDGGRLEKRLMGIEMLFGTLLVFYISHLVFYA